MVGCNTSISERMRQCAVIRALHRRKHAADQHSWVNESCLWTGMCRHHYHLTLRYDFLKKLEQVSQNLGDNQLSRKPLTLSSNVKHQRSWKHNFKEFILTCSSLSFTVTKLDHTQVREQLLRFYAGVSPSWTTHHTDPHRHHQIFISSPKMTEYLRVHHYGLDNEVKTVVRLWFHHQEAQFYCDGLMNIPQGGISGELLYRNNHTQSNHKVQVTCFGFT
jgi:hypothetical protein